MEECRRRFGQFLRAERELRQIPLEEVAAETKIPLPLLQRLEQGSRDGMPPEVFVRGFVRAYARCVGLPEEEVNRRHDEVVHHPVARRPARVTATQRTRSPARLSRILLAVIIAVAIATITISLI